MRHGKSPHGSTRALAALGVAFVGAALVACAGIVGADFSDVTLAAPVTAIDAAVPITIGDSGPPVNPPPDSGKPVIVADGGACPNRLTNCGGLCFDLHSDPDHCQSCDTHCAGDPNGAGVCVSGRCTYACNPGFLLCSGASGCCTVPVNGSDASTDDAGTPPNPGIVCGATHCSIANNGFCCGDDQPPGPAGDFCGNATSSLDCTYYFTCSSSGQCPSSAPACCYDSNPYNQSPTNDPNGEASVCLQACPTDGAIPYLQFCDPAATGECPTGTACTGTFTGGGTLVTTYSYCQ